MTDDVNSRVTEVEPLSAFQRVKRWAEWVGAIATVATLLSSALYFVLATRPLDLVVWFEKVQPVYPSTNTDDLALPLTFQNEPAQAVTLIKVNASNQGSGSIGDQQHLWRLTISEPNASRLELLGKLTPSSNRMQTRQMAQPMRNAYSVQLGVLERRERVEFWLMAIHKQNARIAPRVSTSLAGLPEPQKTNEPLSSRLAVKLLPFLLPLSALGFVAIAVSDLRTRTRRLREARELQKQLHEQKKKQDADGAVAPDDEQVTVEHLARVDDIVRQLKAKDWRRSGWATTRALAANGLGIALGGIVLGGIAANVLGWMISWFL